MIQSGSLMKCLIVNCSAPYHIQCLAAKFLGESEKTELIPVEGECPVCQTHLMWGDLIIHKNGGYAGGVSVSQLPNSSRSNLVNLYSL